MNVRTEIWHRTFWHVSPVTLLWFRRAVPFFLSTPPPSPPPLYNRKKVVLPLRDYEVMITNEAIRLKDLWIPILFFIAVFWECSKCYLEFLLLLSFGVFGWSLFNYLLFNCNLRGSIFIVKSIIKTYRCFLKKTFFNTKIKDRIAIHNYKVQESGLLKKITRKIGVY